MIQLIRFCKVGLGAKYKDLLVQESSRQTPTCAPPSHKLTFAVSCPQFAGIAPVPHILFVTNLALLFVMQDTGTSKEALEKAYKAAAAAASQLGPGQEQFLITARRDLVFTRHSFAVETRPLGYHRRVEAEQVLMGSSFHA